ncbi:MAG: hypothetical protein K6E12_08040 [Saccharofermentans sp.]|nr:hypothetical protein [Saccharofermentans sp.]
MWSYISRDESHYKEVLSESVENLLSYYLKMTWEIAASKGFSPPAPFQYEDRMYLFTDYFRFVIVEEGEAIPLIEQPDVLFGKGNEYACCRIDPDSPVGKTIYVKAKDYAIHLLDMLEERFNQICENEREMHYSKPGESYSYTEYISIRFYYLTGS